MNANQRRLAILGNGSVSLRLDSLVNRGYRLVVPSFPVLRPVIVGVDRFPDQVEQNWSRRDQSRVGLVILASFLKRVHVHQVVIDRAYGEVLPVQQPGSG